MRVVEESDIELASVEDHTIDGPHGDLAVRSYDPGTEGEDRPLLLYTFTGADGSSAASTPRRCLSKAGRRHRLSRRQRRLRARAGPPFPGVTGLLRRPRVGGCGSFDELNADPDKIVVGGDSAGGGLAAGLSLLALETGAAPRSHRLLLYPSVGDATVTGPTRRNKEGYFLTEDDMEWFRGHLYESDIDLGNVYALPLRANDLSELPPATIITAGFDRCATSVRTTPTDSRTPASPSSTTTTTT